MEFGSVLCGRLDEKEVWRRMDMCICMSEPCPPETLTTLLIDYIPIQNKRSKYIYIYIVAFEMSFKKEKKWSPR